MHIQAYKFIYLHIFMQYVHCKVRASVLESGQIFIAQIKQGWVPIKNILWQTVVVHEEKSYQGQLFTTLGGWQV